MLGSVVRRTQFDIRAPLVGGAQHRSMVPSRSRHDGTDRVAKAASDGFALVETERCAEHPFRVSSDTFHVVAIATVSTVDCVGTAVHGGGGVG